MKITVTSLKFIIVGLSVAILGCAPCAQVARAEGPRKVYTIKSYSMDGKLLSEFQTMRSPAQNYVENCIFSDEISIRFKNMDGKQITIINGIIEIIEN